MYSQQVLLRSSMWMSMGSLQLLQQSSSPRCPERLSPLSFCSDFLHDLPAPVKMATLRQRPRDCAAATLMSCLILVSVC